MEGERIEERFCVQLNKLIGDKTDPERIAVGIVEDTVKQVAVESDDKIYMVDIDFYTEEREEHALFDVVLPVAAFAEMDASIVNFDMRLQRCRRSIEPPGEARSEVALLAELLGRLEATSVPGTASEVFSLMASEIPPLEGLDYAQLSPLGVNLQGSEVTSVT